MCILAGMEGVTDKLKEEKENTRTDGERERNTHCGQEGGMTQANDKTNKEK